MSISVPGMSQASGRHTSGSSENVPPSRSSLDGWSSEAFSNGIADSRRDSMNSTHTANWVTTTVPKHLESTRNGHLERICVLNFPVNSSKTFCCCWLDPSLSANLVSPHAGARISSHTGQVGLAGSGRLDGPLYFEFEGHQTMFELPAGSVQVIHNVEMWGEFGIDPQPDLALGEEFFSLYPGLHFDIVNIEDKLSLAPWLRDDTAAAFPKLKDNCITLYTAMHEDSKIPSARGIGVFEKQRSLYNVWSRPGVKDLLACELAAINLALESFYPAWIHRFRDQDVMLRIVTSKKTHELLSSVSCTLTLPGEEVDKMQLETEERSFEIRKLTVQQHKYLQSGCRYIGFLSDTYMHDFPDHSIEKLSKYSAQRLAMIGRHVDFFCGVQAIAELNEEDFAYLKSPRCALVTTNGISTVSKLTLGRHLEKIDSLFRAACHKYAELQRPSNPTPPLIWTEPAFDGETEPDIETVKVRPINRERRRANSDLFKPPSQGLSGGSSNACSSCDVTLSEQDAVNLKQEISELGKNLLDLRGKIAAETEQLHQVEQMRQQKEKEVKRIEVHLKELSEKEFYMSEMISLEMEEHMDRSLWVQQQKRKMEKFERAHINKQPRTSSEKHSSSKYDTTKRSSTSSLSRTEISDSPSKNPISNRRSQSSEDRDLNSTSSTGLNRSTQLEQAKEPVATCASVAHVAPANNRSRTVSFTIPTASRTPVISATMNAPAVATSHTASAANRTVSFSIPNRRDSSTFSHPSWSTGDTEFFSTIDRKQSHVPSQAKEKEVMSFPDFHSTWHIRLDDVVSAVSIPEASLGIQIGNVFRIMHLYEDGWALCTRLPGHANDYIRKKHCRSAVAAQKFMHTQIDLVWVPINYVTLSWNWGAIYPIRKVSMAASTTAYGTSRSTSFESWNNQSHSNGSNSYSSSGLDTSAHQSEADFTSTFDLNAGQIIGTVHQNGLNGQQSQPPNNHSTIRKLSRSSRASSGASSNKYPVDQGKNDCPAVSSGHIETTYHPDDGYFFQPPNGYVYGSTFQLARKQLEDICGPPAVEAPWDLNSKSVPLSKSSSRSSSSRLQVEGETLTLGGNTSSERSSTLSRGSGALAAEQLTRSTDYGDPSENSTIVRLCEKYMLQSFANIAHEKNNGGCSTTAYDYLSDKINCNSLPQSASFDSLDTTKKHVPATPHKQIIQGYEGTPQTVIRRKYSTDDGSPKRRVISWTREAFPLEQRSYAESSRLNMPPLAMGVGRL